jgi:hypothetical protein
MFKIKYHISSARDVESISNRNTLPHLSLLPSLSEDGCHKNRSWETSSNTGLVKAKPQRHPEFFYMHVLYSVILNFAEGSVKVKRI